MLWCSCSVVTSAVCCFVLCCVVLCYGVMWCDIVLYCIIHYTVYTVTNLIGRAIVGADSIQKILFLCCVTLRCAMVLVPCGE